MSRLPSITPKKLVALLKREGYVESGQTGSHLMLEHPKRRMVVIPIHNRDLSRPLMKSIIKQAGFSEDEFEKLL